VPEASRWRPRLQHRRIPFRQHHCIASHPHCRSGESTPHRLHLRCQCHGPAATAAPQQVCLELSGSQVPQARPQKARPPKMRVVVSRAVAPAAMAHPEVPAHQWSDDRCSCARCDEEEPSII
jgi:hypothetical protein